MDKVTFLIPNSKQQSSQKIFIKNDKNPEYIQIAPNVYKFMSTVINTNFNDNDIYNLYNNACNIKNTHKQLAIELFKKCLKLIDENTKEQTKYDIYINLALLISEQECQVEEISLYYNYAIDIFPDRSEPYFYLGIYFNKKKLFEKAYDILTKALTLSYDDSKKKYPTTQYTAYGKYIYDELAVACYWLKKYDQAKILLEKIIDDKDFVQHKERLIRNLEFTMKELNK